MPRTARVAKKKKRVLKTKAERQREIVEVTIQLLAEHGIQGTSVSRIANALGLSKGALYYHFPNREALLAAAMDAMDETATAWLNAPSGLETPARLLAMGKAHSRWTLSARNTFLRPFYQLISSNREDSLTAAVSAKRRKYLEFIAQCAEEGKREGTIHGDADSREIAWCILLHAWGEDIAFLMGDDDYITDGVSQRILHRLLAAYTEPPLRQRRGKTRSSRASEAEGQPEAIRTITVNPSPPRSVPQPARTADGPEDRSHVE